MIDVIGVKYCIVMYMQFGNVNAIVGIQSRNKSVCSELLASCVRGGRISIDPKLTTIG